TSRAALNNPSVTQSENSNQHTITADTPTDVPQSDNNAQQPQQNDNQLRTIVNAIIAENQTTLIENIENRLHALFENKIEDALSQLQINRPDLNYQINNPPNQHIHNPIVEWPQEMPTFNSNRPSTRRSVDSSSITTSSKVAQLISNWDIKFNGTHSLSVANFIYRIETQVTDTLDGNFNILCENAHYLFC
ncbi:hypothetical protein PSTG_18248, partial [Puccinia striiformis f. sp. tritici PST-78]